MNISKIFSKSRQQLIESLEFSFFLYDISISLAIKYRNTTNRSIKFFLKVVSWGRDWKIDEVSEYNQLLSGYPYWELRQYYCIANEYKSLSQMNLVFQILLVRFYIQVYLIKETPLI